jgi:hypothetical protein
VLRDVRAERECDRCKRTGAEHDGEWAARYELRDGEKHAEVLATS